MLIRNLQATDEDELRAFFEQIPEDDRTFFKEDLEEPDVLRRWIDTERAVRLGARPLRPTSTPSGGSCRPIAT